MLFWTGAAVAGDPKADLTSKLSAAFGAALSAADEEEITADVNHTSTSVGTTSGVGGGGFGEGREPPAEGDVLGSLSYPGGDDAAESGLSPTEGDFFFPYTLPSPLPFWFCRLVPLV